ncbi:MAG: hypothetical protein IPK66_17600 [Rhodospirillales bacterium]|nr:hypothetical protein [Rhodospirillales bacterium]
MPQIPIPDPPVRTTIDDPLPQPLIVEIRLYTSPVAKAVLVAGLPSSATGGSSSPG